jgi:hypothetical protein
MLCRKNRSSFPFSEKLVPLVPIRESSSEF